MPEKNKKTFLGNNDCLDRALIDKNPLKKNPTVSKETADYEKKCHEEPKERKPVTAKVQETNVFNFEPPVKEKKGLKPFEGEFPSNFYKINSDRKSKYIENKPFHYINEKGRKDNINECLREVDLNNVGKKNNINNNNTNTFSNTNNNRAHTHYECPFKPKNTEVNEIFEKFHKYIPVRYEEPTPIPGKVDFGKLTESAKDNIPNIRKNGIKHRENYID